MKRAFKVESKGFFFNLKGISVARNRFRPENGPIITFSILNSV